LVDSEPWGKPYKIAMGKMATKQPITELFNPGLGRLSIRF